MERLDKQLRKRVLVISYYWPPAGGISLHRCLKFVKYLHCYDWEPVVCTAENPFYFVYDENNFKDIPDGTEIIKIKFWEPHRIFKRFAGLKNEKRFPDLFIEEVKTNFIIKLGLWIRGNFFIPDARVFWINRAIKQLSKYLKDNPVDAIFSNGPPHSAHMIAYKLKRKFNIPWLADFQDPWTQADYFERLTLNPLSKKIHEKMERRIFNYADKITICSASWKKDLEMLGAKNVGVIFWGYDEDDFKNISTTVPSKFTLSHFGRFGKDRNPNTLWKVLADISSVNPQFKKDLEIEIVGSIGYTVINSIKGNGLNDNLITREHIPRNDALEQMKSACVLLLVLNKSTYINGRLPGKLFEYLAIKRPILVIGPEESDATKIISQTKAGYVCNTNDYKKMYDVILNMYERFLRNELKDNSCNIDLYSNKRTTGELAGYLNSIVR